jgi:peptidoglycan/xylan/chitin deacetylase (PgdA/CDA1 family)
MLGLMNRWFDVMARGTSDGGRGASQRPMGIILTFHEVHKDDVAFQNELKSGCTAAFLDKIIEHLIRTRWNIIALDDVVTHLESGGTKNPFAVLTFDDGYRDTLTSALPFLERHGTPFTTYLATGAVTRELSSWWLGVRRMFQRHDRVTVTPMQRTFACETYSDKLAAQAEVKRWVHQDYRRSAALDDTLRNYDISLRALNETYFMGVSELQLLGHHQLATIGAHTQSHPALSLVKSSVAREEMADSRRYLEALLQNNVRHFAYPYGGPGAVGDREVALAAELGFQTAVTTEQGPIRNKPRPLPHRLPRLELSGNAASLAYCLDILNELRPRRWRS